MSGNQMIPATQNGIPNSDVCPLAIIVRQLILEFTVQLSLPGEVYSIAVKTAPMIPTHESAMKVLERRFSKFTNPGVSWNDSYCL